MQSDFHSKIYEFKGFRLEVAERRLLFEDKPVTIKPKILDLLLFLVTRPGQLVVKEDLMKYVWPDAIVEENNITVSMSILRKTLRDDQENNKFIETVPRQGYRFVAEVTELSAQRKAPLEVRTSQIETEFHEEPIDSLAVLPMPGSGNDPNVEYLSYGITESITNMLSRIPGLRVLACSTVLRFAKKNVDPQAVGQQLNIRAVMMIRVMKLEEKLIIRSELVKVADGSQLWGEQYNRNPSDILAIQEEIAKAISESLRFKLSRQDQIRL